MFNKKTQQKRPQERNRRECAMFNLRRSDTSLKPTDVWKSIKSK